MTYWPLPLNPFVDHEIFRPYAETLVLFNTLAQSSVAIRSKDSRGIRTNVSQVFGHQFFGGTISTPHPTRAAALSLAVGLVSHEDPVDLQSEGEEPIQKQ